MPRPEQEQERTSALEKGSLNGLDMFVEIVHAHCVNGTPSTIQYRRRGTVERSFRIRLWGRECNSKMTRLDPRTLPVDLQEYL